MFGLKSPSQQTQRVTGLQVSTSSFGQCIPYVFGHCRVAHKLIYYSNFKIHQQDNSQKKGGKAGTTNWYSVNADFVLGYGPFEGLASAWENQTWYYVNYSSQTFTGSGTGTNFTFKISNNASQVVMVLGVALQVSYNENYSDYVDQYSVNSFNLTGTSFLPLYNGFFPLPNYGTILNAGVAYATYNAGIADDVINVSFPSAVTNPVIKVYYCEAGGTNALPGNTSGKKGGGDIPFQKGGLVFERQVGYGPSGNPITYPEFSGDGGANIALGVSAVLPTYNYEVKGLFGMGNSAHISSFAPGISPGDPHQYVAGVSSGDCNPADIIADLICSGNFLPDKFNVSTPWTWNHGLGFSNFRKDITGAENATTAFFYSRFGGILKDEPALFNGAGGVAETDFRPTSFSGTFANPGNAIDGSFTTYSEGTVSGSGGATETWNNVSAGTATSSTYLQITSYAAGEHLTGFVSVYGILLEYSLDSGSTWHTIYELTGPETQIRGIVTDSIYIPAGQAYNQIQVKATITGVFAIVDCRLYDIKIAQFNITGGGSGNQGLNSLRNYCLAYDIFVSGSYDSQQSAATVLSELCKIGNCAAVYDGSGLDFIPYCEQSFYGNGTSYVAPTASGPLFTFTDRDFLPEKGKAPVLVEYDRPKENYNSLQIGFRDARTQFTDNFVVVADSMDVTTQGASPGGQENFGIITQHEVAQSVGWALLRRNLIVSRKSYKFSLPAFWASILTPMDFIAVKDSTISTSLILARITSISLDKKFKLEIVAEPYVYGASSPLIPGASGVPVDPEGPPNGELLPGPINTPVIFETVPGMSTQPQIAFSISGADTNWGGAIIWISTDGGDSYFQAGLVSGEQPEGLVATATYPDHVDPDTANTLHVDLTGSRSTLTSVTAAQQNLFQPSLCYLEGGGTITVNGKLLTIPYELISYQAVALTAVNKYDLTQPIRRGVYNTPHAAHTVGSKFAFLGGANYTTIALVPSYIGTTLHFKFTSFNLTGGGLQNLADVTDYTFTPTGQVGWGGSYSITPHPSVYQGKSGGWPANTGGDSNSTTWTDPAKVYFPQITAHFQTKDIIYLPRDSGISVFTNSSGGETAYTSVYDPSQIGEGGGNSALNAYADINPATHYNQAGYIQIGVLTSQPFSSGGGSGGGNADSINDMHYYFPGPALYNASQVLVVDNQIENVTLPTGLVGSRATCDVAPTGSVSVAIKKNGSSIGSIDFAANATAGTFTFSSDVIFTSGGDQLTLVAPSTPDTTFTGLAVSLHGTRN